jgi:ubiquinol-cytochrome c reductase cytochrome c1 subunit
MTRIIFRFPARCRAVLLATALAIGTVGVPSGADGAEGPALKDHADNDVSNVASLQRGARNFVNYCMGCHSAQYVRFNRLAADLQITEQQLVENLMFAAEKPTETMTIAMRESDARRWFGQAPPDLSLIARSRGPDYVFNFLRGFYVDPSRPTGVNNLMLPNTSMPHVLWELQGVQEAVFTEEKHGDSRQAVFKQFRQVKPGTLSAEEYERFVRDTVNFLDYVGEPMQLERQRLGAWVLGYLAVFGLLAYLLKREIWKDVK